MKYDPKYEYFSLLYLLFGSSVLNVLRGPGHFGSVVIKENLRSKYDPAASKYRKKEENTWAFLYQGKKIQSKLIFPKEIKMYKSI